jgi:uncharacterized beta-barrel protein YwiB (DUF1934 family)
MNNEKFQATPVEWFTKQLQKYVKFANEIEAKLIHTILKFEGLFYKNLLVM